MVPVGTKGVEISLRWEEALKKAKEIGELRRSGRHEEADRLFKKFDQQINSLNHPERSDLS